MTEPASTATVGRPAPAEDPRTPILRARSISRPVWERLAKGPCSGRVLAVFERTCLLEMEEGNLVALVLPQIGNGPFNVVLEGQPGCFALIQPQTPASFEDEHIRAGALEVSIQEPPIWEPHPDWAALRARRQSVAERLPLLQLLSTRHANTGSLLQRLSGPGHGDPSSPESPPGELPDAVTRAAKEGAAHLLEGWAGDPAALQSGAARLAGLGVGLTPAGDDFLCGLMLWAWLGHPNPRRLCRLVLETAGARTTTLSAAFLRTAAQGACSAPWHNLLAALDRGTENQIEGAVQEVLACGSTSGADTLAGFMYVTQAKKA